MILTQVRCALIGKHVTHLYDYKGSYIATYRMCHNVIVANYSRRDPIEMRERGRRGGLAYHDPVLKSMHGYIGASKRWKAAPLSEQDREAWTDGYWAGMRAILGLPYDYPLLAPGDGSKR